MALNFSASVTRNIQKIQRQVNDQIYAISIDLFLLTVSRTPSKAFPGRYAKGVLANQWYPQAGGFSSSKGTGRSPDGSDSKARIKALRGGSEFVGKDGKLTLTNNIEYAYRAEVLGWAKTPPYRMVALSLQEIAARIK